MSVAVAGAALAIHPGALGDVLLAIPALRALRAVDTRLLIAAQRRIARLLVALGEADEAHDFDALGLEALFSDEGFPRLPAVERVVCWFGARDPDFPRRLARLAPGAIVAPSVATGEVWRHLLATVGGAADLQPVRVSDALVQEGRAALRACGWDGRRTVMIVHAGAGSPVKCWPPAGFAEALAESADAHVVLHRGPADADAVAALSARLPGAQLLVEPPLPTLAGALAACAMYVGNDSGVSHLAAAVGAPSVVLYTAGNLAWRPWSAAAHALAVTMERADAHDVAAVRHAMRELRG